MGVFNNKEIHDSEMGRNVENIDIVSRSYYLNNKEKNGIELKPDELLNCRNEYEIFPANILWRRIKGVTNFWKNEEFSDLGDCIINILSSMTRPSSVISYCIIGSKNDVEIFVGTVDNNDSYGNPSDILVNSLAAYMPGIDIEDVTAESFSEKINNISVGGLITGYPGQKTEQESNQMKIRSLPEIDNICRGMLGNNFAIMFTAVRESVDHVVQARKVNEHVMTEVSRHVEEEGVALGAASVAQRRTNYSMQRYLESLTQLNNILKNGEVCGIWNMTAIYGAADNITRDKLEGLLKSAFYKKEGTAFEPIRCIKVGNFDAIKNELFLPSIINSWMPREENKHHLGVFMEQKFSTVIDSENLASFCMLPKSEFPGYYVDDYVEFDTSIRTKNIDGVNIGTVCTPGRNPQNAVENNYSIPLNDFTRHALIIGITGGGKTNTSKAILSELYLKNNIPFLVIESAKREYIELVNLKSNTEKNFDNLMLFTLGAEGKNSIKYRINPFEIVSCNGKRVSLQTHIDYLLATFKASFEMYPPMPYVLETAVFEVYTDRGWEVLTDENVLGRTDYPTLTDLYYKIDEVVERLGYDKEVQSNVKAALKARINSLRIGGKGAMMDAQYSVPIEKILSTPTVMELEDLGDDDTKSFVIGLLLVQLYEYRKAVMMSGGDIRKKLSHILMIEEAHRLLKNVSSNEGGRANSVEFFCNMLAEIRTFGQGIVIADQIPTKLASDTIKNTNLKLVHRTVMEEDREAMGHAMNMTPEQVGYLSSLSRGVAAVYAEGDNRPKLVKMPLMEDKKKDVTRDELIAQIKCNVYDKLGNYDEQKKCYVGCSFCRNSEKCEMIKSTSAQKYDQLSEDIKDRVQGHLKRKESVSSAILGIEKILKKTEVTLPNDEKYCMACSLMDQNGYDEELHVRVARSLSKVLDKH